MTLYDKIISIYPTLNPADFYPITGTIVLQNDGNGDYIKEWNHSTLPTPTQIQLDTINK
jgi:hypothetical protein